MGSRVVAAAALAVTVWLLPALSGCESMQGLLSAQRPTARVTAVNLESLALDGATLAFDVEVTNPYGLPLPVSDIAYSLASGEQTFLSGTAQTAGTIPAQGARTLRLPARIAFAELLTTVAGVRPGAVVPYTANLNLSVDAPQVGTISLPLSKSGQLPVPAVPQIEMPGIAWSKIALDEAIATVSLRIRNTNEFPVDLRRMQYDLSLGGTRIASSSLGQGLAFGADGWADVRIPISISPLRLGTGVINLIRGQGSAYELAGTLEAATPFGALTMPYRRTGQTVFSSAR